MTSPLKVQYRKTTAVHSLMYKMHSARSLVITRQLYCWPEEERRVTMMMLEEEHGVIRAGVCWHVGLWRCFGEHSVVDNILLLIKTAPRLCMRCLHVKGHKLKRHSESYNNYDM